MCKPYDAPQRRPARSFYLLLLGQTASLAGSQVTLLTLPLTAIELDRAGPFETNLLLVCGRVPYLILGQLAGAPVDRSSHRIWPMMANAAMALSLATVPLAATFVGYVNMLQFYAVVTTVGAATMVGQVAFLACVPIVVQPPHLVKSQSGLELGQSAALVLGLPLAGWLITTFCAPIAILTDAASFLFATTLPPSVTMRPVRDRSPTEDHKDNRTSGTVGRILSDATEGAPLLFRTSRLRAVTFATAMLIFFCNAYSAVFLLDPAKDSKLTIDGMLLARSAAQAHGLGSIFMAVRLVCVAGAMFAPALQTPGWLPIGLSQFLLWTGQQLYDAHQVPIRYALTPSELRGCVNASIRSVAWGLAPLGAVLGGACGDRVGPRTTVLASRALIATAVGWIMASPLRAVRTPQLAEPASSHSIGHYRFRSLQNRRSRS